MISQIIGWTGSAFLAAGLFGIGNKNRDAFFFTVIGESLWIIRGLTTGMYDLVAICCVFIFMAIRAYRAWGAPEVQNCTREAGHSGPCNGWCCRNAELYDRGLESEPLERCDALPGVERDN